MPDRQKIVGIGFDRRVRRGWFQAHPDDRSGLPWATARTTILGVHVRRQNLVSRIAVEVDDTGRYVLVVDETDLDRYTQLEGAIAAARSLEAALGFLVTLSPTVTASCLGLHTLNEKE